MFLGIRSAHPPFQASKLLSSECAWAVNLPWWHAATELFQQWGIPCTVSLWAPTDSTRELGCVRLPLPPAREVTRVASSAAEGWWGSKPPMLRDQHRAKQITFIHVRAASPDLPIFFFTYLQAGSSTHDFLTCLFHPGLLSFLLLCLWGLSAGSILSIQCASPYYSSRWLCCHSSPSWLPFVICGYAVPVKYKMSSSSPSSSSPSSPRSSRTPKFMACSMQSVY